MSLTVRTAKDIKSVVLLTDHADGWVKENGHYRWKKEKKEMFPTYSTEQYIYWTIQHQPKNHQMRYGFFIQSENETILFLERGIFQPDDSFIENDINSYFAFPYMHESEVFQAPKWVNGTIWYQIMPDRFANPLDTNWGKLSKLDQHAFHGGTILGIQSKMDYLEELGVTGLYLTPIFQSPTAHKYDTTDYFKIDPAFGTMTQLKELVSDAHSRGIRVILDGVFNHIGDQSPFFKDVLLNGQTSKYKEWFYINQFPLLTENGDVDADRYRHFTPNMPKLNTLNQDVQEYILNVAQYWMEETNIDGWRLDVANEVDHEFWRKFKKRVKSVNPDAYIVGEIWHNADSWLQGDQFDGVMNYPLTKPILEWIAAERINGYQFQEQFVRALTQYSDNNNEGMLSLLDSHDAVRLKTYAKNDSKKVAICLALLFLMPGSISLYYGTEIELDGGEDPENRKPMNWSGSTEHRTFQLLKNYSHLRKKYKELFCNGQFSFLHVEKDSLIIKKETDHHKVFLCINNGDEKCSYKVDELENVSAIDLKNGDKVNSQNELTVDPKDYLFFLYSK